MLTAPWPVLFINSSRPSDAYMHRWTIIGSDNGLLLERRQVIIWTNAGILLIAPLGTNFSEILIEIQTFSLKKIRLKMSSAKCCSLRPNLNVLTEILATKLTLRFQSCSDFHVVSCVDYIGESQQLKISCDFVIVENKLHSVNIPDTADFLISIN